MASSADQAGDQGLTRFFRRSRNAPVSELSPNFFDLDRFSQKVKRVEKPWGYEIIYAATPQ